MKTEHAAELKKRGDFESVIRKDHYFMPGVHAIFGLHKGPPRKQELQGVRFDAKLLDADQAKGWLQRNKFEALDFEPASGGKTMSATDTLHCSAPLALGLTELQVLAKSDEFPNGVLVGYAARFNNVDKQGDIIRPGAFTKTIAERVAKGRAALMTTHLAYGGGAEDTIGEITAAKEDSRGLKITAPFYETQDAQNYRSKVKASPNLFGLSVGYAIIRAGDIRDKKTGDMTGKELKELKLFEVTVELLDKTANEKTNAQAKTGPNLIASLIEEARTLPERLAKALEGVKPELTAKAPEDQAAKTAEPISYSWEIERQKRAIALIEAEAEE